MRARLSPGEGDIRRDVIVSTSLYSSGVRNMGQVLAPWRRQKAPAWARDNPVYHVALLPAYRAQWLQVGLKALRTGRLV